MPALGTKLGVPRPRRALVERARLRNPFGPGAGPRPRLVLLAAPPGFGKTTLLTQWLSAGAADPARRVAWVALDERDADVHRFLAALVESLVRTGDGVGAEARAMLENVRTLPVEDVLASLLADLDDLPGPTVIALDDYHRAAGPPVNDAVGFLLDNLPPQVVVAMTTRADPPLPLARLRARGELLEFRAADLRFTRDEAAAFLHGVMDLDLEPAQVAALEARTEGWVAGLQLAGLSARSRVGADTGESVGAFIDAFSGSHRFVVDYLVGEVLDAQPADVRRFLLLTSVLDQLSGPLCDAVTGTAGGQARLEQLDRDNVFLVALDDQRGWFRYHHLFADALRARLLAEQPGRMSGLHRAASRWYVTQGLLEDALAHAQRGGDEGWLAEVVELALPGLRRGRRDGEIVHLLDALPEPVVRSHPVLAIARAWTRLSRGDLSGAADWLEVAEGALPAAEPDTDDGVPDDLAAVRRDERRTVPAGIAIYRAALAQAAGDVAGTVREAQRAEAAALPGDHFVLGASAGFLGLAAWAAGDLVTGAATFRRAVGHLGAAGNVTDQLGATVVLATMALAGGDPAEARRLYEDALRTAGTRPGALAVIGADLHVGLADVLREQDELPAAAEQLRLARELGPSASLPENRFRRHAVQAGLLVALGDPDGALAELDLAQQLYLPGYFPDTRPLPAARARALVRAGRLDEARRWAVDHDVPAADPADYLREDDLLTWARLVVAGHRAGLPGSAAELGDALEALSRVVAAAERAGRGGSVVEARVVRALARAAAGDVPGAQDDLGLALAAGVPAGFRRRFLDEGAPLAALLDGFVAAGRDTAGWAARLRRGRQADQLAARAIADGPESLSERELDVVRLLASDLTGPEIAAHLFVSINTLRTHTRHIFTKLDVRTRRAAVRRAEELQLLSSAGSPPRIT